MRKSPLLLLALLLLPGAARADAPVGKIIEDVWEVAHLEGARVGTIRTTVREYSFKQGKVLRTSKLMDLTLKRFNALVRLRAETGTDETPDGRVTGVYMRLSQPREDLLQIGTVTKEGLHVRVEGRKIDKVVPWNDQVIGLHRQDRLLKEKNLKPGDTFSFLSYEPTITYVVTLRVKVGAEEEVETLKGKRKLLRVEVAPDKVQDGAGNSVKLPATVLWLDEERNVVRQQMELPGMGTIISQRTTREIALAEGGPIARVADVGERTYIPLNRPVANPHSTAQVVYRITVKDDDEPTSAIAQDARQTIKNVNGNTFDLHVRAVRAPEKGTEAKEAKEEYRKSCYYLNSDDARVQALAREAVGDETDPLRKARRIERWVHTHLRVDNSIEFVPAGEVARLRAGDCRQHAMLTAAMCRAAGVPSRTAVGLIPAHDPRGRPVMAYHMWAEVWVQGQWLAIDAILGQGAIGAAHVKIADQSWYDVESLKPMLAVQRVLGKLAIEVVSVDGKP